jgi:hypothetical protein
MLKSVKIGHVVALLAMLAAMGGTATAGVNDANGAVLHGNAKVAVPHR